MTVDHKGHGGLGGDDDGSSGVGQPASLDTLAFAGSPYTWALPSLAGVIANDGWFITPDPQRRGESANGAVPPALSLAAPASSMAAVSSSLADAPLAVATSLMLVSASSDNPAVVIGPAGALTPGAASDTALSGSGPPAAAADDADAMYANVAQTQFGLTGAHTSTGTPIKIGIISDSFDTVSPGSAAADEADGWLPADTVILRDDPYSGGTDEGRAMAEVVHQAAPGAAIYFYSAEGTEQTMADGIAALEAAGCQIIVDDVTYLNEPIFQAGDPVEQAIGSAEAAGVDYFTAVTNNSTDYFEQQFTPMLYDLPGSGLNAPGEKTVDDVSGGSPYETVDIAPGTNYFDLQWGQPFSSFGSGTGATYTIGVAVYEIDNGTLTYDFSVDNASLGGDPVNVITVNNTSSVSVTAEFAFYLSSGVLPVTNTSETDLFEMVAINSTGTIIGPDAGVGSGASLGHNEDPAANTVAAVNYGSSPAFGVSPPQVAGFSSYGPGEYLYNAQGTLITPAETLDAPTFAAPDGSVTDVPKFVNGFYGTSAAAPNAAAAAALLLQEDGYLSDTQITYLLADTAIPTGNTLDGGAGLIDVDNAASIAADAISMPIWTDQGGTSLWSLATNWSDDAVPGSGSAVVIGNGLGALSGAYTVTYDLASSVVASLTIDGTSSITPATPSLLIEAARTLTAGTVSLGQFGTLDIAGTLVDSGSLLPASGGPVAGIRVEATGELSVGGTLDENVSLVAPGAHLVIASSNDIVLTSELLGTISNFQAGDTIEFSGLTFAQGDSIDINAGVAQLRDAGNDLLAQYDLASSTSAAMVQQGPGDDVVVVACFALGTLIATPEGERRVETLRIGDSVTTAAGVARRIRWIGRRSYRPEAHEFDPSVAPVRICAGALDVGVPARDLRVSAKHAMVIDGVLVPAEGLVNGQTIFREPPGAIDYVHVELDSHDVILAEGAPTETFCDTGNRYMFANAAEYAALYPDDDRPAWNFCAERVEGGDALLAIRRKLARRALLARLPGPMIEADGVLIAPREIDAETQRFIAPAGTRALRLVSPSVVPARIGAGADHRALGFAVSEIVFERDGVRRRLSHADVASDDGWHVCEGGHRWMSGDALLPAPPEGDGPLAILLVARPYLPEFIGPASRRARPAA